MSLVDKKEVSYVSGNSKPFSSEIRAGPLLGVVESNNICSARFEV